MREVKNIKRTKDWDVQERFQNDCSGCSRIIKVDLEVHLLEVSTSLSCHSGVLSEAPR